MARSDEVVRYIDHLRDCSATDGLHTASQSNDRLTSVAGRQPAHQHQLYEPKTAQLNKGNTHESDTRNLWDACDRPPLPSQRRKSSLRAAAACWRHRGALRQPIGRDNRAELEAYAVNPADVLFAVMVALIWVADAQSGGCPGVAPPSPFAEAVGVIVGRSPARRLRRGFRWPSARAAACCGWIGPWRKQSGCAEGGRLPIACKAALFGHRSW